MSRVRFPSPAPSLRSLRPDFSPRAASRGGAAPTLQLGSVAARAVNRGMATTECGAGGLCFETRGLTKVYGSGPAAVQALRGVDIDLPDGEMVVVLGASGSGKSTFLNILGGLDTATSGQVLFRGQDISRASERELTEYRRRHVGFVFQFYNLMP